MNNIIIHRGWLGLASALALLAGSSGAQNFSKPDLIPSPVDRSYAPQYFNESDNAQVVIAGTYPNSCYHVGHTQTVVDRPNHRIDIQISAYKKNGYCLMVLSPYQVPVTLGLLDKGDYAVVVNQDERNTRTLTIQEGRNPTPSDRHDAPVSQILRTGAREFLLRGTFRSSCMKVSEVKVSYQAGEVILIEATTAYDSTCVDSNQVTPFETRFRVKDELQGDYLVHVRTLNGDPVNLVQSFSTWDKN